MKIKKSTGDNFFYCLFCIVTFGGVWVTRLIITTAIRKAFENQD